MERAKSPLVCGGASAHFLTKFARFAPPRNSFMLTPTEIAEVIPVIVSLVVIEGLLSVDNALAIADDPALANA